MSGSACKRSASRVHPARVRTDWRRSRSARTSEPVTSPTTDPTVPGSSSAWATSASTDCICCGSAFPARAAKPLRRRYSSSSSPGVLVLPVPAQGQIEGRQWVAQFGEGEPDSEDDVFEVVAGGTGEVDPDRHDSPARPDGGAPLRRPVFGAGERGLEVCAASEPGVARHLPVRQKESSKTTLSDDQRTGRVRPTPLIAAVKRLRARTEVCNRTTWAPLRLRRPRRHTRRALELPLTDVTTLRNPERTEVLQRRSGCVAARMAPRDARPTSAYYTPAIQEGAP